MASSSLSPLSSSSGSLPTIGGVVCEMRWLETRAWLTIIWLLFKLESPQKRQRFGGKIAAVITALLAVMMTLWRPSSTTESAAADHGTTRSSRDTLRDISIVITSTILSLLVLIAWSHAMRSASKLNVLLPTMIYIGHWYMLAWDTCISVDEVITIAMYIIGVVGFMLKRGWDIRPRRPCHTPIWFDRLLWSPWVVLIASFVYHSVLLALITLWLQAFFIHYIRYHQLWYVQHAFRHVHASRLQPCSNTTRFLQSMHDAVPSLIQPLVIIIHQYVQHHDTSILDVSSDDDMIARINDLWFDLDAMPVWKLELDHDASHHNHIWRFYITPPLRLGHNMDGTKPTAATTNTNRSNSNSNGVFVRVPIRRARPYEYAHSVQFGAWRLDTTHDTRVTGSWHELNHRLSYWLMQSPESLHYNVHTHQYDGQGGTQRTCQWRIHDEDNLPQPNGILADVSSLYMILALSYEWNPYDDTLPTYICYQFVRYEAAPWSLSFCADDTNGSGSSSSHGTNAPLSPELSELYY